MAGAVVASLFGLVLMSVAAIMGLLYLRERHHARSLLYSLQQVRSDFASELREAEHFRVVAKHAGDGLLVQDLAGKVLWVNDTYCRIMALDPSQIIGRNPLEFALPPESRPSSEEIAAFRYDPATHDNDGLHLFRNLTGDGREIWVQISVTLHLTDDLRNFAVLVCRDVTVQIRNQTELEDATRRLEYSATHDSLTGLANREQLYHYVQPLIANSEQRLRLGILHIDLDNFKEINDSHGHAVGDMVLRTLSATMLDGVGEAGLAARIGGDEFLLAIPHIEGLDRLAELGEDLRKMLCAPLRFEGLRLAPLASVGAVMSGQDTQSLDELMLQSDFALYEAKRRGRDQTVAYDAALRQAHLTRKTLQMDLKKAIESDGLNFVFQPVIDLPTGRVTGVETLVRWSDQSGMSMAPSRFLAVAEEIGRLAELDFCSLRAALDMKKRLDWTGHEGLSVSFNASARLLRHPEFVGRLLEGVEERRINPGQIVIEILETAIIAGRDALSHEATTIAALTDAGFQVHLDDFGIGYAGLAHLRGVSATGIKIDRSLINGISTGREAEQIVKAVFDLCRQIGLDVVAEGVETEQIAASLTRMGLRSAQGYWFARPMEQQELLSWLENDDGALPIEQLRPAL